MPPYSEDEGGTVVRIEKQDMERLGIMQGDIVRISKSRDTPAVCLAADAGRQEAEAISIQYINTPKESYPIARLSNAVFSNAAVHGMGTLVRLEKLLPKEEIVDASTVTISTTREAEKIHGQDMRKESTLQSTTETWYQRGTG